MRLFSALLPALPGIPNPQSRSSWPVWRDSVAGPVRFAPMSRKAAAKLWHAARRWDRETRRPGRHGGVIGRTAFDVFYVLALDFQNFRTGRLDPSHEAIAARVGCCPRTVRAALARLRELGMIAWQRRCEEDRDEVGRFRLRQRTNAYRILPPSHWRGYRDTDPPPDPATLGAPERVPEPIEAAVAEFTSSHRRAALAGLDTGDALSRALASFGRAIESEQITGRQLLPRNLAPDSILPPETDLEAAKRHWLGVLLVAACNHRRPGSQSSQISAHAR